MSTTTLIPVTVTPEAAVRIAELGLQASVDRMVEHARQVLPEIDRIDVETYERSELGWEPGLAIEAWSRRPFDPEEHISWELDRWLVNNFPPEVLHNLHISYHAGPDHAG